MTWRAGAAAAAAEQAGLVMMQQARPLTVHVCVQLLDLLAACLSSVGAGVAQLQQLDGHINSKVPVPLTAAAAGWYWLTVTLPTLTASAKTTYTTTSL